jgi:hypothetical protein
MFMIRCARARARACACACSHFRVRTPSCVGQAPEIHDLVLEELSKNSINLEVLSKDCIFTAVDHFVNKVKCAKQCYIVYCF